MFECRQLVIQYPSTKNPAVQNASFHVRPGEIVSLVGESGSGKSSIAYAIGRLLKKDTRVEGEILLSDINLLALHLKEMDAIRKKDLAFIFQDPTTSLNPLMKIRKQFFSAGVESDEHSKLLSQVELKDAERILDAYPHELSGGMKQRIMIAIAISKKPKLIIADEPTASLDATVGAEIMKQLQSLSVQNKCSMLMITHDLKIARKYSDRTIFMKEGKVIGELNKDQEHTGGGYIQQLINASDLNQQPKSRIVLDDV